MKFFYCIIVSVLCLISSRVSGLTHLGEISCSRIPVSSAETSFIATCPVNCEIDACNVYGTDKYRTSSSICCAGIHTGTMSLSGGVIRFTVINKPHRRFRGTSRNGIRSHTFNGLRGSYFTVETYHNIQTTTSPPVVVHNTTTAVDESTTTTLYTTKSMNDVTTTKITNHDKLIAVILPRNQESKEEKNKTMSLLESEYQSNQDNVTTTTTAAVDETLTPHNLNDFTKGVVCALSLVLLIAAIIGAIALAIKLKKRRDRAHANNAAEPCVCYSAPNQSQQGLLNDPETCDRPCKVREKIEEAEKMNNCSGYSRISSSNCKDCTGCYNNQYIDF